jgi:2-polyprenyl-6-methoxyphenol hydroxylase-like FAD-dependent oxidoreductase
MTPNIAQGACQAVEDAVVLAKSLAEHDAVPAALRAYEARRIDRTGTLVKRSRMVGAIGQWRSPLACAIRDKVLLKGFQRAAVRNDERLFSFEV